LHHTSDPRRGFERIVHLVKPGGYVVIGLYNRYGRLALGTRRLAFNMTGGRGRWLDPYLRSQPMAKAKSDAWFADQYQHPHESTHTMGEVLEWFGGAGVDFLTSIPKAHASAGVGESTQLFAQDQPPTASGRMFSQARQIVTGSREGGFFVMIGQRRRA
jgi:hypothetical protein